MIDATDSFQAAAKITSGQLVAYLAKKRWTITPSRMEGVSIASKQIEGMDELVLFPIPMAENVPDAAARLADALRTLAAVEQRSEVAVGDAISVELAETSKEDVGTHVHSPKTGTFVVRRLAGVSNSYGVWRSTYGEYITGPKLPSSVVKRLHERALKNKSA